MNFTTTEEFIEIQKSALETSLTLATRWFESGEKFVALNVEAAKEAFNEATGTLQATVGTKDPQELVKLQFNAAKPVTERCISYLRKSSEIAQAAAAEITKVVSGQVQEAQKQQAKALDNVAKNAPAGSESLVNLIKSSVATASTTFESAQKAVKQATDIAQANLDAVAATASGFAKQPHASTKAK